MKRWAVYGVLLSALLAATPLSAQDYAWGDPLNPDEDAWMDPPPSGTPLSEVREWGFHMTQYTEHNSGGGPRVIEVKTIGFAQRYVLIAENDVIVWSPADEGINYGAWDLQSRFQDINGDGDDDIVVSLWTGGAHCCISIYALSLYPEVKKLGVIDQGHGDPQEFQARDGGGLPYVQHWDGAFAYWMTSFAGSIGEFVRVSYRDGGFHLDEDLMRDPKLDVVALAKDVLDAVAKSKNPPEGERPFFIREELYLTVAEALNTLVYSGNADRLEEMMLKCWPDDAARAEFLTDYFSQLKTSTYIDDLNRMNGGILTPLIDRYAPPNDAEPT